MDGIFPPYPILVTFYSHPAKQEKKEFNRLQEAMRKDTERLYAVITARFHIDVHPAGYSTAVTLCIVSNAVATIHNIVTELRREGNICRESGGSWRPFRAGGHVGGPGGAGSWGGARGGGPDVGEWRASHPRRAPYW